MVDLWGTEMPKIKANAETIRQEIKLRIEASTEIDGDCKECGAPTPRLTDPVTNDGCNWTVDVIPGVVPGCLDFVKHITRTAMVEYELLE
ncbi:MAG: hypothetical protein B7Y59_04515 [Burkholderiales bacterium 35-55-47]|jgi:hypothetical protein|nr:MAG: hypothetical protein B7Y59_04515 [Burkholderiales bacterium 35-55-47]OYZ74049.1 MAG: hypothetical protein B7Y06_00500 [Burkholderiales bacterium 24-55-52]OZB02059.1 MAG: hypothetical protein B7X62_04505 [Burkholderiales bacterium 39-55-53]